MRNIISRFLYKTTCEK